ncbi:expressed unknown protein [Seminavis robusta]|uniref:Uncharacterized protein n=1 Tax=Seminavis robusta TaxID=568900 RepID=A0A9N8DHM2_9STRA|nr:expressed unknown protein [Seminavis robusta]|eukprot:Sro89_g047100.1 n/a (396) ;mRNA; f:105966-107153
MTGLYQVPVSGRYNLEVIVIHCNDHMHNMKQHGVDAKSQPGAMNIDEHLCIEDPYYHRLTEETTKIWVDHTAATLMQPKRDVAQAGYWRRRDDAGVNNDGSQTLLTRFQSTDNHFWETPSNPTSMGEYVYDALLSGIVPKKEDLLLGNGSPQICLLGSRTSHQEPQQLAGRIKSYLRTRVGVNVTLTWSIVESPLHVTKAFAQSLIESQNCRKIVITGVPPWHETNDSDADPTSAVDYWDGVHAIVRKVQAPSHQVGRYRDEVEGMLRTFVNFRSSVPEESGSFDLYLLPLPYRPLDLKMTSCPPLDWRSPPVIDGYNVAMAEACEALGGSQNNVTFLDTRPILDPLWDSVDDWGRSLDPDGTVLTAEANYIANYILDLFKPVEKSVVVGIGTRR